MALRCALYRRPLSGRVRGFCSPAEKRTALYDFHASNGGKFVDFAGWQMPALYGSFTPLQSVTHTRQHASLFDVSHMLQWELRGRDSAQCLESLCTTDVQGLANERGTLSVLTNEQGGIIDDFIINRISDDCIYVVSNAGNADKVIAHVKPVFDDFAKSGKDVSFSLKDGFALVALQGPQSAAILEEAGAFNLSNVSFMGGFDATLFGVNGCRVTRCGYTGEDGFEISVPSQHVVALSERLLAASGGDAVKLAGLAARDTLRLEAGLCLHGSDIDDSTSPVEAGLAFVIGKKRRESWSFPGGPIIRDQLKNKPSRQRVGFMSTGPVARAGSDILDDSGSKIGHVTSGAPSPSLGKNIAMGYVASTHAAAGTAVKLQVRQRLVDSAVTKMPFVPARYYIAKK
ncbi:aminomethyltransferase, mitochondrial-like [Sycon ciliatum]|uniref:aminomethyltransferase, mitochondrial-like n=1 Tax=Sycon ciliatum TaxID=27933 RepID=UPI0031F64664